MTKNVGSGGELVREYPTRNQEEEYREREFGSLFNLRGNRVASQDYGEADDPRAGLLALAR
ncbi:hypothetical protein M3A49_38290 [Paraburkholderia sp. CNPSo 3076]|uniref:hypothetical protein n=1 Tax=Paraburkholderia sp. CNPSo 3076 TaxID=2940936 RepID=UPI0022580813|nr:hypothetical protein [Paraburkholderia sp. CNPSo 3076]MCX5545229.1 hypothetical protein [Paraburkholderia sp. CNPSo 3076]